MIDSELLYFLSNARRKVVALILLLWSNADGQRVFLGDEHSSASALRDDAAAMQRAVALLHFDQEIDAGRTVQLIHDHASAPLMMNSPPPIMMGFRRGRWSLPPLRLVLR